MEDNHTLTAQAPVADETVVAAARQVIEQAKGAVMLVYSVDADQAFAILRVASQDANVKLRQLAAAVVAELPEVGTPHDIAALRESLDRVLFAAKQSQPD
ncbi:MULTISPECIES: ANTAR domain-containing protein [Nocardia]|uniref:ANTAR domain-containing protein n=1 Tax=Nocardia TaxID=1817 RepID=UPI000D69550B|nr:MULTISPECIES: ANTAR domain-containing protein [Nocardia]